MNPRRGRPTLREQMALNQRSLDIYAMAADKPRLLIDMPPEPKKRAPAGSTGEPLEKNVQSDIIAALRVRPDVVFVGRFNSGTSVEFDNYGKKRVTKFFRLYTKSRAVAPDSSITFLDVHGMLRGGKGFWIEVKRTSKDKPSEEQANFIAMIVNSGGIAGVAASVDEAVRLLDGWRANVKRKEPSSCGYCDYFEDDGTLKNQCAACKAKDAK